MKVRDYVVVALWPLTLALAVGDSCAHKARAHEWAKRANKAAADLLKERTEHAGLVAKFGRHQNGWLNVLAAKDSQLAFLNREVTAARAHALSLTEVLLSAKGQGETKAEVTQDTASLDSVARAHIEDGPLDLAVSYNLPAQLFGWSWQARMTAEFFHTITPDRRLLVNARSTDPRVTVQIPEFVYELPREQKRGFPWKATGLAALGGFSVCAVAK